MANPVSGDNLARTYQSFQAIVDSSHKVLDGNVFIQGTELKKANYGTCFKNIGTRSHRTTSRENHAVRNMLYKALDHQLVNRHHLQGSVLAEMRDYVKGLLGVNSSVDFVEGEEYKRLERCELKQILTRVDKKRTSLQNEQAQVAAADDDFSISGREKSKTFYDLALTKKQFESLIDRACDRACEKVPQGVNQEVFKAKYKETAKIYKGLYEKCDTTDKFKECLSNLFCGKNKIVTDESVADALQDKTYKRMSTIDITRGDAAHPMEPCDAIYTADTRKKMQDYQAKRDELGKFAFAKIEIPDTQQDNVNSEKKARSLMADLFADEKAWTGDEKLSGEQRVVKVLYDHYDLFKKLVENQGGQNAGANQDVTAFNTLLDQLDPTGAFGLTGAFRAFCGAVRGSLPQDQTLSREWMLNHASELVMDQTARALDEAIKGYAEAAVRNNANAIFDKLNAGDKEGSVAIAFKDIDDNVCDATEMEKCFSRKDGGDYKTAKTLFKNYFEKLCLGEKRLTIANAIRTTRSLDAAITEADFLKGSGPALIKLMQGVKLDDIPNDDLRKVVGDLKNSIPPISEEFLYEELDSLMKQNKNIASIKVTSLTTGAGSVAMTLSATLTLNKPVGSTANVIIKVARPNAENRFLREKKAVIQLAGSGDGHVKFLAKSWDSLFPSHQNELNMLKESGNITNGFKAYAPGLNTARQAEGIKSTSNCLVMEKADGKTLKDICEEAKGLSERACKIKKGYDDVHIKNGRFSEKGFGPEGELDGAESNGKDVNINIQVNQEEELDKLPEVGTAPYYKKLKEARKDHLTKQDPLLGNQILKKLELLKKTEETLKQVVEKWTEKIQGGDSFFHADLHEGNMMVNNAGNITLIDFGNTGTLKKDEQTALFSMVKRLNAIEPGNASGAGYLSARFLEMFLKMSQVGGDKPRIASILSQPSAVGHATIIGDIAAIFEADGDAFLKFSLALSYMRSKNFEIPDALNRFSQATLRLGNSVARVKEEIRKLEGMVDAFNLKEGGAQNSQDADAGMVEDDDPSVVRRDNEGEEQLGVKTQKKTDEKWTFGSVFSEKLGKQTFPAQDVNRQSVANAAKTYLTYNRHSKGLAKKGITLEGAFVKGLTDDTMKDVEENFSETKAKNKVQKLSRILKVSGGGDDYAIENVNGFVGSLAGSSKTFGGYMIGYCEARIKALGAALAEGEGTATTAAIKDTMDSWQPWHVGVETRMYLKKGSKPEDKSEYVDLAELAGNSKSNSIAKASAIHKEFQKVRAAHASLKDKCEAVHQDPADIKSSAEALKSAFKGFLDQIKPSEKNQSEKNQSAQSSIKVKAKAKTTKKK